MRVNVNDSPDAWRHHVYLNDVPVKYAIEADDEAGYVLIHQLRDGMLVQGDDGQPIIKRIEGTVRIVRIVPPAKQP